MSFNKAREEKKWRAKKTEEELLRKLGVSEAVIEELRRFDREQFNSDRRFYRYLEDIDGTRINVELFCIVPSYEITSIEQMLDDIENPKLFHILKNTDNVSQLVLLMRLNGIDYQEISQRLGISENAAKKRFSAIKKKIQKIF